MSPHASSDVTRIVLLVCLIMALLAGTFWTLLPFLGALIWATTIVVATWPILLWLDRKTGKRALSTTIMTLLILLALVVPLWLAITTVVDAAQHGPALLRDFMVRGVGPPPDWIAKIPLAGEQLAEKWQSLSAGGPEAVVEAVRPYSRAATAWLVSTTGGVGLTLVHIVLTIVLAAILYAQGETAARGVLDFGHRMGGARGEQTIRLAGQAARSVALGVVVTALVQSVLAGIGLWICGVPHAGVLTAIAFVFGIAQIGPLPVLLASAIWLFATGETLWGTVLILWSIPVIALDNVLRPILIRRGVDLPMLLIIAGVIGGLMAFGVMGLFVGPVVLAATYTLTRAWIADDPEKQQS